MITKDGICGIGTRVAALLLFALVSPSALSQDNSVGPTGNSPYLIQPGDVLLISVWREEYLERNVAVQPDGKISFPLVGVMDAAGLYAAIIDDVKPRLS